MEFESQHIAEFRAIFNSVQPKIEQADGCNGVKLFVDSAQENVYYTHSSWNDEDALNAYRNSTLFKETWSKTKTLFAEKARAYSLLEPK
jgi:quinol monooxygenase YgiN